MSGKSYSQKKREKFDYRREYFKHNPGIFGQIWTCAYCHRPLVGKQSVVVDHVMPLNNVLGKNARYNLVAACKKCNLEKSDKVDYRVAKGYLAKVFEVILFSIQKLIIIVVVAVWTAITGAWSVLKRALLLPFCKTGMKTKLIAAILYAIVFCYLISKF